MPENIDALLSYVHLTETVQTIQTGIPKVLPEGFWSNTEKVLGNTAANVITVGTRRLAQVSPYGAPARVVNKYDVQTQAMKLLSARSKMMFQDEFLNIYRQFQGYAAQKDRAAEIVAVQCDNFKQEFDNLRVAAVTSLLALGGRIHFDVNGNMLNSAVGADLTVDMGVPAGNITNSGASWANAATDIVTFINNLKTTALQTTGYRLKYAFYGKNVAGYISRNTSMQYYLARNSALNDKFITTGQIPEGVLDLTWVPVQDAFFEDQSGTIREIFPADQVTFFPELSRKTYTLYEGTTPFVPSFQPNAGASGENMMANVQELTGIGSYAKMTDDPPTIEHHMFDCFLPRLKIPASCFFIDTTP